MINMASLISDPTFCETFVLRRKAGIWNNGEYTESIEDKEIMGIVRPLTGKEINQLPEGDRYDCVMVFYTIEHLRLTGSGQSSDELIWQGGTYKALKVKDYGRHGFYETVAGYTGEAEI